MLFSETLATIGEGLVLVRESSFHSAYYQQTPKVHSAYYQHLLNLFPRIRRVGPKNINIQKEFFFSQLLKGQYLLKWSEGELLGLNPKQKQLYILL